MAAFSKVDGFRINVPTFTRTILGIDGRSLPIISAIKYLQRKYYIYANGNVSQTHSNTRIQ